MIISQIDYTAKDFSSLKKELTDVIKNNIPDWTADSESDFGVALVNAFAYMGDLMSYYIDRAANEANIQTTTQTSNLLNFAETYGYSPSGPVPAYLYATIANGTGSTINLPVGTQIMVTTSTGPYSTIYFELVNPVSNTANGGDTGSVLFNQVYTSNTTLGVSGLDASYYPAPVTLGTSDGYAYQEFEIPEIGVVDGSIALYTGQSSAFKKWYYVDNLIDYGFDSNVYTTKMRDDGTTVVVFGDGINGAVPTIGDPISVTYQISYGSYGNLPDSTIKTAIITYVPGYATVPTGLTLSALGLNASAGGADMEDLSQLRVNIQTAMQTRNRAVTLGDYVSLATLVPGVARASAISSVYTIVSLYVQPYSDGTSTPGLTSTGVSDPIKFPPLANAVQNYIQPRCPINTSITVNPPSYVSISLSATLILSNNYKASEVKINVASRLLNSTTGLFSYNGYGFGDDVLMAEIYRTIMSTPGVNNVTFSYLAKTPTASYSIGTQTPTGTTNISLTTGSAHGFSVGQTVVVSGVTPNAYNGTWVTQAGTTSTTFTLVLPISYNPGAITVAGSVSPAPSGTADIIIAANEIPYLTAGNLVLTTNGGI